MSIRLSYYSIIIIIMLKHAIAHLQLFQMYSQSQIEGMEIPIGS